MNFHLKKSRTSCGGDRFQDPNYPALRHEGS